MNEEQFDSYKFSINTEIKIDGEWIKVIEVDFENRSINGKYYCLSIEDIR